MSDLTDRFGALALPAYGYAPRRGRLFAVGALGLVAIAVGLAFADFHSGGSSGAPFGVMNRARVQPFLWMGGGVLFVGLALAGLVHAWRGRHDRVELRERGLVRFSRSFGTKLFGYDDVVAVEAKRGGSGPPSAVHVTTADDVFVNLIELRDLDGLERELRARCPNVRAS